jgi:anti-sigma regulatory factor (Ser/Thr protein kinase)
VTTAAFTASYACASDTPSVARHELDRWLPDSLAESQRGALRLLVSELVTNSIRHGAGTEAPVALDARIDGGTIRVEVRDRGAGFEMRRPVPRGAAAGFGGYGLFLVERMATRWGVDTGDGTRVWFELDLAAAAS